jgi:predicted permease
MDSLFEKFLFSGTVTGPICLMLFLGILFRRIGLIDGHFIEVASRLVYNVTLPALLFLSVMNSSHDVISSAPLVAFGVGGTLIFFIILTFVTHRLFPQNKDNGVIIQGAFRGNVAVIALAYVSNAYGNDALAVAALYVAGLTFTFNVLSVITLSPKTDNGALRAIPAVIKSLTKNPLIIAIVLGVITSQLQFSMPKIANDAGRYLANMTLPLALMCGGGSLDLRQLYRDKHSAWFSTGVKLIFCPLVFTSAAILMGFRGLELGIIFLTSSSPTAAASFVLAKAMNANGTLAANIIVISTLLSIITSTLGIFLLSSLSLI